MPSCDHPLDGHVNHGPWCEPAAEPWDTTQHMAPDPAWPAEMQLAWFSAASLVLALNASELCRRKAARRGDQEAAKLAGLTAGTATPAATP